MYWKAIGHEVIFHDLFIDNTGLLWVSSNFGAVSIHFDSQDFEILMSGGDILCSSDYCSMRGITQDSVGTIYCSFYNSICAFDCKTNKRQDLGFQISRFRLKGKRILMLIKVIKCPLLSLK